MNTFIRFFYEFISVFFDGASMIFKGLFNGLIKMFSYNEYRKVITSYSENFKQLEWLFVALAVAIIIIIVGLIGVVLFFAINN